MTFNTISALFLSLTIAASAIGVATASPSLAASAQDQLQAKKRNRDPVRFQNVVMVNKPKALLGDSSDPRCGDASVKCFENVDDILFGRTRLFRNDDLVLASYTRSTLMTTSNSQVTTLRSDSLTDGTTTFTYPTVIGAHMFNTASEVAVSLWYDRKNFLLNWQLDNQSGVVSSGSYNIEALFSSVSNLKVVAGDFNNDGLDEVVIFLNDLGNNGQLGFAVAASATDTAKPASGLKFGPPTYYSGPPFVPNTNHVQPLAVAKADVLGSPRVFVAGPVNYIDLNCTRQRSGVWLESFSIDPTTLALASDGTFTANLIEGNTTCLHSIDITSGRFSTGLHDQLLVAYSSENSGSTVKVIPFDFNEQGIAVQQSTWDSTAVADGGFFLIRGARFNWGAPHDQAALLVSNCFNCEKINSAAILTADQNFNISPGPWAQLAASSGICLNDMAVGNFNKQQKSSSTSAPLADPNLQIAISWTDCSTSPITTSYLNIYDVDPTTSQITLNSSVSPSTVNDTVSGAVLATVDLQGRSLVVGEPSVVTINSHNQASVILAAPPMHVDYIAPVGGSAPSIMNISAGPDGFYSSFHQSDSNDYKTNTTNDTTWSFAAEEKVNLKFSAGNCDDDSTCGNSDTQLSAKQALDGNNATISGNFYTNQSGLNIQSSFSDEVLYQNETRTIYVYPVIGRFQCPSSLPNCSDDQKTVPLLVNMSGSDTITTTASNGADLPWYQPTWIPGNILSYPQSLAQLQAAAFPGDPSSFQGLGDAVRWSVSNGASSQSLSWTNGSNTGSTSSFNRDFSFDAQTSMYLQWGITNITSVGVGLDLDLSGSRGFSTLTDSMTTLSKTQGLDFTITARFPGGNYEYFVTPYVFGQTQPGGVVDGQPLSTAVQTYGALRMGHVVDFETCGLSCFWKSTYGQGQPPDLALNQPKHWVSILSGSDKGDGSCITFGSGTSDYDCITLGIRASSVDRNPKEIGLSEFHIMRGLFIQGPSGTGPQVGSATVGDQLVLTARVYNLSLSEMPVGSTVHVRFMAFPWDTTNGQPAGASYLIGEQTMAPIPAFNSLDNPGAPNYALISQPFDTNTACGGKSCDNQDLAFWVTVWAEDSSGNLMTELPYHGLNSVPASSDDFFDVGAREESYSNNLGLYDQVFRVFSKPASPDAVTANAGKLAQSAKAKKREVGARLTQMGRSPGKLRLGSHSVIAARVKTGSREFRSGLTVQFYDGHPDKNGRLFGQQTLPYLKAKTRHDFRANYRPQECGRHRIFALVGKGTRHEHLGRMPAINVKCTKAEKASFPPKT